MKNNEPIILKIDIEGYEFNLVDQIVKINQELKR